MVGIIGETKRNKSLIQNSYIRYPYFFTVQISLTSFPSIKTFIATDLIYNTQQQFFPIPQGNTDAVRSHIMDIVGGSVERIDHPTILLVRQASRTLFGNKPCFTGYLPYFRTKVFQVRYSNHRLIFLCSALI